MFASFAPGAALLPQMGAGGNELGLVAGEGLGVEHLVLAAGRDPGEAVDAGDGAGAVARDGVPRERVEFGGLSAHLLGALEADDLLGVAALLEEEVGPVAGVGAFVVGEAGLAGLRVHRAVRALVVVGGASGLGVDTELELASRGRQGHQLVLARAAVDGPVVVAVVVHGALAVEQQAVLAHLLGEGAVGAEVEVVAEVRVRVGLDAVLLWAALPAHQAGEEGEGEDC